MGAKTASKPRLRSIAYKCDFCGRKFTKLDNLKSHQRTVHDVQPRQLKSKLLESKTKNKLVTKDKSAKTSTSGPLSSNNNQEPEATTKTIEDVVEFECPKCFRTFPKYFPALKHIQKFHCVNKQGAKVPANSPYIIQPVRIELCRKCNRKVKSIPTHICDSAITNIIKYNVTYTCSACDEAFTTLRSFDIHVSGLHGDKMESLFFPSNIEFAKWKTELEVQTKVKYSLVDKYESKCFYHCNYENAKSTDTAIKLCPSTIVVQELAKGIQANLYKAHFKHTFVAYKLPNKYKKYEIKLFNRNPGSFITKEPKSEDEDMYIQFKTVMENIILDAAKVDVYTLKILLTKALEMTSTITSYEEKLSDNEDSVNNKNMNESDILNALLDKSVKRKSVTELKESVKRVKVDQTIDIGVDDTASPKILNCYSLATKENVKENVIQNSINVPQTETQNNKSMLVVGTEISPEVTPEIKQTEDSQPDSPKPEEKTSPNVIDKPFSSFDESYADFLSKNFNARNDPTPKSKRIRRSSIANVPNNTQNRKKVVMKTKIGQFKGISPRKDNSSPPANDITTPPKRDKPVPSEADTPTGAIKNVPKKDVVSSPKKDTILKNTPKPKPKARISLEKPKVDIAYEVKEQEDDCNILILKI